MSTKQQNTNQTDLAWWYAQQKARLTLTAMEPFEAQLVGVTYDGRQTVISRLQPSEQLTMSRQPDNRFDTNAIEVLNRSGQSVGFLARDLAAKLASRFDLIGRPVSANVIAIVGDKTPGKYWGVRIHFELPMQRQTHRAVLDDDAVDEMDLNGE